MNKVCLLLIVALMGDGLLAQESSLSSASELVVKTATQIITHEPQVSPIMEEAQSEDLIILAPPKRVAAGVCSVIGDMLAQFCSSKPQDISCQFH